MRKLPVARSFLTLLTTLTLWASSGCDRTPLAPSNTTSTVARPIHRQEPSLKRWVVRRPPTLPLPGESRLVDFDQQQPSDFLPNESPARRVLASAREQIDLLIDSPTGLLSLIRDTSPERSCRVRLWNPSLPINHVDHEFDRSMQQIAAKQLPVEILIADQQLLLIGPFLRGWDTTRAMLAINDPRLAGLLLEQSRRDANFGSAISKPLILAPSGPWHRFVESRLRRAKRSIDCISVEPEWAKELHRAWGEGIALRGMLATDSQVPSAIARSLADVSTVTLVDSIRVGQGGASIFVLDRERTLIAFPANSHQLESGSLSSVNEPSLAIELADPGQVQEWTQWIDRTLGAAIVRRSHRLQHSLR